MPKALKDARLSKDRKWRLFPQDGNLLQYVGTGMFYGRVKVSGKIIRRKLDTTVYTTAKLRLLDFLKEQRETAAGKTVPVPSFKDGRALFEQEIKNDPALAPKTVAYKEFNLKLLARTWVDLDSLKLTEITPQACVEWSGRLAKEVSAEAYNHTLGVFRSVFDRAAKVYRRDGGPLLENPADAVKRLGVKPKKLQLPEPEQFLQLVKEVAEAGGGFSRRCADLIQFLAFSGCRISEAKEVKWSDVDWQRNEIVVHSVKRQQTSSVDRIRRIPIIPPMKLLLERLQKDYPDRDETETVCMVYECEKAMTRACAKIGINRITHHDLRHLFATRAIESGVDIPTVSRWLGHVDGGALAMRTYGHLRNEHSQAMAAKVKF